MVPYSVAVVNKSLPAPHEYYVVPNSAHFAFLSPCPPAAARVHPDLCTDAPGFDRIAFHNEFDADVLAFCASISPGSTNRRTINLLSFHVIELTQDQRKRAMAEPNPMAVIADSSRSPRRPPTRSLSATTSPKPSGSCNSRIPRKMRSTCWGVPSLTRLQMTRRHRYFVRSLVGVGGAAKAAIINHGNAM